MDNYSYNSSYPESGDSSPRGSRDIEFENPSPWENNNNETQNPNQPQQINYKVKFMCSYNGKIHPRPHDNQLSYVGGETKILSVDRSIKFPQLLSKLITMCDNDNISFKYQLPGEDLDALISVTCDDDLEHMMHEYDRLYKISPKPARLRIFIFPSLSQNPSLNSLRSFGSEEGNNNKSEKERFVDALNSAPILPQQPVSPAAVAIAAAAGQIQTGNADFLFGSEKVGLGLDPTPDPIQKHIQDLERLRLEEQQNLNNNNYRRKSDDSFENEYYRVPEKLIAQQQQQQVPVSNAYSQIPVGAGYPVSNEQPVYMIPAQASGYHAPQMVRQVAGAPSQGYYTIQRMPQDYYREQQQMQQQQVQQQQVQQQQQMYGMMPSPSAVQSMAAAPPSLQQQQVAATTTGYSDYGMVRPSAGVGMVAESGYAQMAYDGGMGRQVIYTQQGAVIGAAAGVGVQAGAIAGQYATTMGGAGLGPEKVVVKATQQQQQPSL